MYCLKKVLWVDVGVCFKWMSWLKGLRLGLSFCLMSRVKRLEKFSSYSHSDTYLYLGILICFKSIYLPLLETTASMVVYHLKLPRLYINSRSLRWRIN